MARDQRVAATLVPKSERKGKVMSESEVVKELEAIEAMFVQSAPVVEHAGGRIVLRGVAPSTLYFSDRPQRVVGHIGTSEFVDIWGEGDNSFAKDPPNAVLAFAPQGGVTPQDVVIEIRDPAVSGKDLSYAVTVLDGSLPARAEGCTLFIDPFGRPLSPVSVAGVMRRQERRAVRRML
jgi:hypothetical protein